MATTGGVRRWCGRAAVLLAAAVLGGSVVVAVAPAAPAAADHPHPGTRAAPAAAPAGVGFYHFWAYTDPVVGARNYYVQMDPTNTTPEPLVIALHGFRQTAGSLRSNTTAGLDAFAVAHHVVLAYAEGFSGSWNAGPPCCGSALARDVDDVAYLRAVAANVAGRTAIDPTRIYLLGFSNGGMMAFRAAVQAPDVFAAACAMSGDLLVAATAPVKLCEFHDPADTTVPWRGGAGLNGMVFPPVWSVPLRLPAGSVWVEFPHSSRHAWSPGSTAVAWQILSGWRLG